MSGFVVHALLGVKDGRTDEASQESASFGGALALIREIAEASPTFRAITLVHSEDWPSVVGGAVTQEATQ